MKKRTTGILIGIVCLLLLAGGIGSYVVQHLSHAQKIAVIYQDDTVVRRIDLNAVTESYTITISGEDGAENVIRVSPGSMYGVCQLSGSSVCQAGEHLGWNPADCLSAQSCAHSDYRR